MIELRVPGGTQLFAMLFGIPNIEEVIATTLAAASAGNTMRARAVSNLDLIICYHSVRVGVINQRARARASVPNGDLQLGTRCSRTITRIQFHSEWLDEHGSNTHHLRPVITILALITMSFD